MPTQTENISLESDGYNGNTRGDVPLYKQKTCANEKMRIITWNVRGLANKEEEVERFLEMQKTDFAVLSETKRKGQGTSEKHKYIVIQAGVNKDKRAVGGVMLYIHKNHENAIEHYNIWSERIVSVRMKSKQRYTTIIGIYAPEEGKEELSNEFYETLQKAVQRTDPKEDLVIARDLNAQVGSRRVGKTVGTFGAGVVNTNGKKLIDFCVFNNLRILNSFYRHKDCHKYTWSSRGSSTIIDYVIPRENLAKKCSDTRVYRGFDLNTDHFPLQSIFTNTITRRKKYPQNERINIRAIDDPVNKWLFTRRTEIINETIPINHETAGEWENFRNILMQAAKESLGKINSYRKPGRLRSWDEEAKRLVDEKQEAFRKWMRTKKVEDMVETGGEQL